MCAAPMASFVRPQAFDRRTRTLLPPRLARAVTRSVWLLKPSPSVRTGLVVQVPTQRMSVDQRIRRTIRGVYGGFGSPSAPYFAGRFHHQAQLGELFFFGERIPFR